MSVVDNTPRGKATGVSPWYGVYRKPKTKSIIVCSRPSDFQGPFIEKSGEIGKGQGQRESPGIINAPGMFDLWKGIGGDSGCPDSLGVILPHCGQLLGRWRISLPKIF